LIFENISSKKWQVFFSKTSDFCSKGSKQQKMAIAVDFRASAGREFLWTTGEKTGFSRVHCEVPKQPNLEFSYRGLKPSP
jgi:hypothetical protein